MADDPDLHALKRIVEGLYRMWFPHGIVSNIGGVPLNQTAPVVTVVGGGQPVVGATVGNNGSLSVSTGTWNQSPTSYAYQWEREGVSIGGATNSTYAPVLADFGCILDCQVTASNAAGASLPARSNLAPTVISATAFYVSSSGGNDSNSGTSTGAPWKTLRHVADYSNSTGFSPGTSILFKRGDKWDWTTDPAGPVVLFFNSSGSSGNPIIFDAYGSGANPIVDGSVTAFPNNLSTDWTNPSGNIWVSAKQYLPPLYQTATITSASPCVVQITGGFAPVKNDQAVVFGGTLPSSITAGQIYYVAGWPVGGNGNNFNISTTVGGGSLVNNTGALVNGATVGLSGLPYFAANDVGNILWNFAPLGGSAPAQVMTASFGKMTGGDPVTNNVWYKPGDGTNHLGTANGNWNFNTDNCRVQIVSTGGNPFTAMSDLRLVLDSGLLTLNTGIHDITIQNFTIQNAGASDMVRASGNNLIIRDIVAAFIGGGNIGGGSGVASRAGDLLDMEGTYSNVLVERCYCYQFWDDPIGPQLFTTGPHDNMTIRNNIFYHWDKAIELIADSRYPMNGVYIYNNTSYGIDSWSDNQRPNNAFGTWGFEVWPASTFGALDMRNNVYTGIPTFGILLHDNGAGGLKYDFSEWTSATIDYNNWKLLGSGNIQIAAFPSPSQMSMATWKSTYPQFEVHGLIDTDPSFKSNTNDFTPNAGSPLRNAGANLFTVANTLPPNAASGVVWDFFRNQRPSSGNFTIGAIQG